MAKRRTSRTSTAPAGEASSQKAPETGSPRLVVGLVALSFLTGILATYQWLELIRTLDGVQSFCAIGEGFDCAEVWSSGFAKAVHRWTGMPLAGWGLVWSVAALASALAVGYALMTGRNASSSVAAARWTGAAGIGACVLFLAVSIGLATVCITCLTTYALVALYGVLAFRLRDDRWLALPGLRIPAAAVLGAYLVLLYPGRATPISPTDTVEQALGRERSAAKTRPERPERPGKVERRSERGDDREPTTALGGFLRELPGPARRAVVDAVEAYRSSEPVSGERFGERPVTGDPDAPVKIVDFVDVGCGHCATLMENLELIRTELPNVSFAVETRYFPLDGACNDVIPRGSGDPLSVRCLGAKLLLCAQDDDAYPRLKEEIFEHHRALSADAMFRWATEILGQSRADLERCVRSSKIEAKLAEDVAYARLFDPKGTPLVVVNGREGSPLPPFLYAIILARGDPKARGFAELGF